MADLSTPVISTDIALDLELVDNNFFRLSAAVVSSDKTHKSEDLVFHEAIYYHYHCNYLCVLPDHSPAK